jgi:hypothetical protein
MSKPPKSRYEKVLFDLLCPNITILATLGSNQTSSEINSMLKFLDRLRSTTWSKKRDPNSSMLLKLKRKLEKIKDSLKEHPEESLEGEYQVVKSKILSNESSISLESVFQPGLEDVKEVKILQHQASLKENFLFDVMMDPCMPIPHEEWVKLIVEQDVQVTQLRHSVGVIEQENLDLLESLKTLKQELENLKQHAFNCL